MSVSGSVSRVNSSCHVMEILLMERLPAPIAIIYRVSYIPGDFLGFLPWTVCLYILYPKKHGIWKKWWARDILRVCDNIWCAYSQFLGAFISPKLPPTPETEAGALTPQRYVCLYIWINVYTWKYSPRSLTWPLRSDLAQRRVVFQPFFRGGAVQLQGCNSQQQGVTWRTQKQQGHVILANSVIQRVHPPSLARPWKMVVGRRSFCIGCW